MIRKSTYKMLTEIRELKQTLKKYYSRYAFKVNMEYTFLGSGIRTNSVISFEMPEVYDNFSHANYRTIEDIYCEYKDRVHIPNLEFQIKFEQEPVDDFYDVSDEYYNDYYDYDEYYLDIDYEYGEGREIIYISPDEYVMATVDVGEAYILSDNEADYVDRNFKPHDYIGTVYVELSDDKVTIKLNEFSSNNGEKFKDFITHVKSVNDLVVDLNELDENHSLDIPKLEILESKEQTTSDFIKLYHKEMPSLKNYFKDFLKDSILENTETYLWVDRDRRTPIDEAIVIEHTGYEFNWNHYPTLTKAKKGKLPKLHSYQDKSWTPANFLYERKNETNGIATRNIVDNYSGTVIMDYLWSKLQPAFKRNIFLENYTCLKLSLSEGSVSRLETDVEGRHAYGFNQNGKVVFFLDISDGSFTKFKDFIKDEDKLLAQLNLIILELTK